MPKEATDDLLLLVKSLTKTEKTYFKKYGYKNTLSRENSFIKLFDILCKIPKGTKYDEKQIKKIFSNARMLKQFHASKNYLYNLIMRSLRDYHRKSLKTREIIDLIHNVEILYSRGLYAHCQKAVNRAKQLAELYEEYTLLIEISNWQKKLVQANPFKNIEKDEIEEIFRYDNNLLNTLKNINEYWRCSSRLYYLYKKKGGPRNKKEFSEFEKIFNESILNGESKARSYQAMVYYLNIKVFQSNLYSDAEGFYKNCIKMMNFRDGKPMLISTNVNSYVSALSNLLSVQIALKKYDEATETIKKMRNIRSGSRLTDSSIFINTTIYQMGMYINMGEFENGLNIVTDAEAKIPAYFDLIKEDNLIIIYYFAAYMNFGAGRYNDALKWLNLIFNGPKPKLRMDVFGLAQILNMIVHYKLNNYQLLEYTFKSTYRFFLKKNKLYKAENIVLSFFRKLPGIKDRPSLMESFKYLIYELNKISNDDFEKEFFQYFDVISWLESEIERKDFMKVIQEKYKKNLSLMES